CRAFHRSGNVIPTAKPYRRTVNGSMDRRNGLREFSAMTEAVAIHGTMPSEMRRNALILAAASAIIGAIPAVLFTLGGLTGLYLLGADKSLATVPIPGYPVGLALGTVPAAALMRASGRRFGFLSGACINVVAGLMAGGAVIVGSFILFVIAMAVA